MLNFDEAYKEKIEGIEGIYSNDKDDKGDETYRGIARNYHPNWPGWEIVDLAKRAPDFPKNLNRNAGLQQMVRDFYKKEFWDVFNGDVLKIELAKELFDIAVNCSQRFSIGFLQRSLNILNNNQKLYPDIIVDGCFGPETLRTIENCLKTRGLALLCNVLNFYQAKYYIDIMERNSRQEKYIGWFGRIEIIKN